VTSKAQRILPLLFITVLMLDQATKYIALSSLKAGISIPVLGDFLRFTLVFNPGGAFSMRLGNSTYYLITSLIIFFILIYYAYHRRQMAHIAIPLSIVAGGAAGNIIDRFRFGRVIDFIDCEFFDIHIGSYHMERWPIFNVADMAVSCGIITTIILIYYHSRGGKTDTEENETTG